MQRIPSSPAVAFFADAPPPVVVEIERTADVEAAIAAFLALAEADRLAASAAVHACYEAFLDVADTEPLPIEEGDVHAIWRFVTPLAAYVQRRHHRDQDVYVALHCDCTWEPEHGVQLVFRGGSKLVRVSEKDGHLTDADAYARPDPEGW